MMDETARRATIRSALDHLRIARNYLRDARASKAADAVARALKSAQGAERHADRLVHEYEARARAVRS